MSSVSKVVVVIVVLHGQNCVVNEIWLCKPNLKRPRSVTNSTAVSPFVFSSLSGEEQNLSAESQTLSQHERDWPSRAGPSLPPLFCPFVCARRRYEGISHLKVQGLEN